MSWLLTSPTVPFSFNHHDPPIPQHNAVVGPSPPLSDQPPILSCMLAGGMGGMLGDTVMYSLDTVKTRQQGLSHVSQYRTMFRAFSTIWKNEGVLRGLYGGYSPAILGSFPLTAAFFGAYEYCKRKMIDDYAVNENIAYFVAGVVGDLASSVFYVPLEVLKTRLQLQGRYNNPHTIGCGYNYRGLSNAIMHIAKHEGAGTFIFGFKETLIRDLPFSALQFAFYERFRQLAIYYHSSSDLPVWLELGTGAAAGSLAGTLTTPLDVIKTRIQTGTETQQKMTSPLGSTWGAIRSIVKNEGIVGAFSGVGPRCIWTGVQSSIMLLLYQMTLKKLHDYGSPSDGSRALGA